MAWATPDDVISAWVGPEAAPDDTDQVALWIARAERRIRAAVPDIQSRIDADEPDLLENAIDVAVAMVLAFTVTRPGIARSAGRRRRASSRGQTRSRSGETTPARLSCWTMSGTCCPARLATVARSRWT